MTTVAQMIEWLKTLPQDAIVECPKEKTKYCETYVEHEAVDLSNCDVFDYTGIEYKDFRAVAGKVIVSLN